MSLSESCKTACTFFFFFPLLDVDDEVSEVTVSKQEPMSLLRQANCSAFTAALKEKGSFNE